MRRQKRSSRTSRACSARSSASAISRPFLAAGAFPTNGSTCCIARARPRFSKKAGRGIERIRPRSHHRPDHPHVRGLRAGRPAPGFLASAPSRPLADIAADLVGPDVKFHSSRSSVQIPGSGRSSIGTRTSRPGRTQLQPGDARHLPRGCAGRAGPLTCIPGSHQGPIFVHRDDIGLGRSPKPTSAHRDGPRQKT